MEKPGPAQRIIKLYSIQGFIDAFWEYTKKHNTYTQAYEELELEYIRLFGARRYSCYDSFRVVRDRVLNTRKQGD